MVSLLISDRLLQYVVGKSMGLDRANIDMCGELEIPEGVIERGFIKDEGRIQELLKELKKTIGSSNDYHLILASNAIIAKMVRVPVLADSKLKKIIREEMKEYVNDMDNTLYDYSVLEEYNKEGTGARILCVAANKNLIEGYSKVFLSAGITLASIDIAQSAQAKMISHMSMLSNKTFILGTLFGNELSLSLYSEGVIQYYNRYSISQRGNLGLISELSRIISNVIQFSKSENFKDVEKVFFCGMKENEKGFCTNITNTVDINVAILPESSYITKKKCKEYSLPSYMITTGNLYRGK